MTRSRADRMSHGPTARMEAADRMTRFAERTGLTSDGPGRRYLWTDAFAVCNFLGLARATGEPRFTELALRLVDRVHHTLGRHRADDVRRGWISGLGDADGEAHPTLGGLRIGKPLPERAPGEPLVERLEWDRDGQYFHYLTKWMHALAQLARATGRDELARFARELADVAHRRFVHGPLGRQRMHWKMSIDLMRPLVASMGQHDPLDGYVTCLELTAEDPPAGAPDLAQAIADYRAMIDADALATEDPLGIGGLLVDAHRLARLQRDPPLQTALLRAAQRGLERYLMRPDLRLPAEHRLAFRELGLAIGLAATTRSGTSSGAAAAFARHASVRDRIESFWLEAAHQESDLWREHLDINEVMLATCLAPDGFLGP